MLQAAQWDYKFAFTSFPTQMSENKMSWDEVGAIGIRAHYLEPIYQGQQVQMAENDNMLELAEYQVTGFSGRPQSFRNRSWRFHAGSESGRRICYF